MIREIISFYKIAPELLNEEIKEQTLGDYLKKKIFQNTLSSII